MSRVPGRRSETLELLAFELNSELRTVLPSLHGSVMVAVNTCALRNTRQPWGKHDSHVVGAESEEARCGDGEGGGCPLDEMPSLSTSRNAPPEELKPLGPVIHI